MWSPRRAQEPGSVRPLYFYADPLDKVAASPGSPIRSIEFLDIIL